MNEKIFDVILNRVSCRSFINEPIDKKIIQKVLTAATKAPSSGNMQPWEFIVIDQQSTKDSLVSSTFSGFYSKDAKSQQWIVNAPIIIVVCINYKRTTARYGSLAKGWAPLDTASAVQNMILTASSLGIGCCWVGGFRKDIVRQLIKIPAYVKPVGLLPMGYPAKKESPKHKLPPEWVTHHNQYNIQYFND